jgi:hypothetical protein
MKAHPVQESTKEAIREALRQDIDPDQLDPRLVHPYAISVIAEHYGYKISIQDKREDRVTFVIDCPTSSPALV